MTDRLQLALQNMTPTQRRRYKHYINGWGLTDIARKEGVSIEAVRQSIDYAKRTAKKRLGHLKNT